MPFGFGRSFTSFGYSGLTLLGAGVGTGTEKTTAGTYAACDDIRLQVTVENTGAIDSDEVVQLYTSTPDASVPAPRVNALSTRLAHTLFLLVFVHPSVAGRCLSRRRGT